MDAATGKQVWRWYTTPGPNDPGGDTWPTGRNEYLRGGATIWQAPAVDPKLGLLYFSTGNAGSDWFGGDRPGKNLYAALDRRARPEDRQAQVVLPAGPPRHLGLRLREPGRPLRRRRQAQGSRRRARPAGSTCSTARPASRSTASPEKPVPQNAEQKTWPTQPIPNNGEFTPHGTPSGEGRRAREEAGDGPLAKVPVVVAKKPFTPPPPGKLLIYGNGPQGGVNWQPVSYNEKTHMIYVCSSVLGRLQAQHDTVRAPGKTYTGVGGAAGVAWPEASGHVHARSTRRAARSVWQKTFPEPCYAGTATTAGNLVFVGRNNGELQAYNARTASGSGASRPAPARTTRRRSSSRTARSTSRSSSGGNSLAATPHGDSLWLFGLDGTLGPAPTPGKGTGTEHDGRRRRRRRHEGRRSAPARRSSRQLRGLPRRRRARRQRRPRPDGRPDPKRVTRR